VAPITSPPALLVPLDGYDVSTSLNDKEAQSHALDGVLGCCIRSERWDSHLGEHTSELDRVILLSHESDERTNIVGADESNSEWCRVSGI